MLGLGLGLRSGEVAGPQTRRPASLDSTPHGQRLVAREVSSPVKISGGVVNFGSKSRDAEANAPSFIGFSTMADRRTIADPRTLRPCRQCQIELTPYIFHQLALVPSYVDWRTKVLRPDRRPLPRYGGSRTQKPGIRIGRTNSMKETRSHQAQLIRLSQLARALFRINPFFPGGVGAGFRCRHCWGLRSRSRKMTRSFGRRQPDVVATWRIGFHEDGTYLAERIVSARWSRKLCGDGDSHDHR